MLHLKAFFLLIAMTLSVNSFAVIKYDNPEYPRHHTTNGCNMPGNIGVALLEILDTYGSGPKKWNDVCDRHDICYAIDGVTKSNCDLTFKDHLEGECRNAFNKYYQPVEREICYQTANLFYKAVRDKGASNWNAAQAKTKADIKAYAARKTPSDYVYPFRSIKHIMPGKINAFVSSATSKLGRAPTDWELYQEYCGGCSFIGVLPAIFTTLE